ncbi:MAG TPA: hypothetical protein VEY07_06910 [Thermoplasmata archaeon]|nr:hypothetical protein [Thermoplasmata archaeon]
MASGRAVRIPRRGGAVVRIARTPEPVPAVGRRENVAGSQRARRLFLLYVAGVVLLYLVVLGSASSAPGGLGANAGLLGVIALIGVALGVIGWWVTLGQTPRALQVDQGPIVVWERLGRQREFPNTPGTGVVVRRFPAGWLSAEPAVLVRLKDAGGLPRVYLLDAGLVPPGVVPLS